MQENNFTEGKILGKLFKFALPILMALCLQALYGAVDAPTCRTLVTSVVS